jgi:hypothetical protein
MTRSEATLLILIVIAAGLVCAASGVQLVHAAHHFGEALQLQGFGA